MKRAALLLALILAVAAAAMAQRQYSPEFYIGGHAGATLSQMQFSPSVPQSFKTGFMAGVTACYTEENHFGLIAELNLQQRGWQENFKDEPFAYSRTTTYIQIPLLTHIYFGNRRFKGFFNAGPEVSFMIGNSVSANFDYTNYRDVPGFPLRNRVCEQLDMKVKNRFDYGISAGAGMQWMFSAKQGISLEARFYYGIANIFPDAKRDLFNASRGYSIEVMAGYTFRLK